MPPTLADVTQDTNPPAATEAAPVPCPLCEYDLRSLTEPRCPECGYRFTWQELSDPSRRFHPYVFEHHPHRNAWSFVQTLLGGLSPSEFWSTLYPTQPSRPPRIVAYWVLCAIPLLFLAALHVWLTLIGTLGALKASGFQAVSPTQVMEWAADQDVNSGAVGLLSLMCLAWPWLTLAALLVFQASLRRAKLRPAHVLRCVLYSADVSLWLAAPVAFVMLMVWAGGAWPPQNPVAPLSGFVATALWMLLHLRLFKAYELYLRFDHAFMTVLASQVIVGLVYWKLWLLAQGY